MTFSMKVCASFHQDNVVRAESLSSEVRYGMEGSREAEGVGRARGNLALFRNPALSFRSGHWRRDEDTRHGEWCLEKDLAPL